MKSSAISGRGRSAVRGGLDNHLDVASDPEFATHHDDPLVEPIIVFQLWKGRHRNECIRVTLSRYQGAPIADIRVFFTTKTGHMQASKKGIAVAIAKLRELLKALEKAEAKARELGLLDKAAQ